MGHKNICKYFSEIKLIFYINSHTTPFEASHNEHLGISHIKYALMSNKTFKARKSESLFKGIMIFQGIMGISVKKFRAKS